MFSDADIYTAMSLGHIDIHPFSGDAVQPASIDFHLAEDFLQFANLNSVVIPHLPGKMISKSGSVVIEPGEFLLGATKEYLRLGPSVAGFVHGKSSLGRIGLAVHITAGYIDPGFAGHLTLELNNVGPRPILLTPGMAICQIAFARTETPCLVPYHGRYTDQNTPEPVGARGYEFFKRKS